MANTSHVDLFKKALEIAAREKNYWSQTSASISWFQDNMREMMRGITPGVVMGETERLRNGVQIGHMYMVWYDPKWKKELPYYDQFPLIIPVEPYSDGFAAINLHYLPYPHRAVLLGKLLDVASDKKYNERTRLAISYSVLKAAAKFKGFEPCYKRYLNTHFRSKFLKVPPKAWQVAIFMPVERFKKAGKTKVWSISVGGK